MCSSDLHRVWISTHTPLTGRDEVFKIYTGLPTISTHTPLTGRDDVNSEYPFVMHISTHTPLTGRDRYILYLCNGTFPHIGTDLFLLISFI